MTPTEFTPLASTIGGVLIGVAFVMLMLFSGRIAGISGILGRLFPPFAGEDPRGAAAFVIGLIAVPLLYAAATGSTFAQTVSDNARLMAVAGLLVTAAAAPAVTAFAGCRDCRCALSWPRRSSWAQALSRSS
jgi:uncharacterized protein